MFSKRIDTISLLNRFTIKTVAKAHGKVELPIQPRIAIYSISRTVYAKHMIEFPTFLQFYISIIGHIPTEIRNRIYIIKLFVNKTSTKRIKPV